MISAPINLLPQRDRTGFRRHRRVLVLSRTAVGIGALALIVGVFAVSAWRYAAILSDAERARRAVLEHSEGLVLAKQFEEKLAALSDELKVVRDLQKPQYDPSLVILDIVRTLPRNAQLNTLTLQFEGNAAAVKPPASKSGVPTVFLAGRARSRADVLEYQHALEALSYVDGVEAPIENILRPFDTDFTFSLLLRPLTKADASSGDMPVTRVGNVEGTPSEDGLEESLTNEEEEEESLP